MFFNFAWFREQTCLAICPYGRLQSVLTDPDSLVIGYDEKRGEPRGKAKGEGVGDCVDCNRCVVVCPTGIDIRNGLQLDCIGCARCIDACDDVMDKLHRPRGLVRYDSLKGPPPPLPHPALRAHRALPAPPPPPRRPPAHAPPPRPPAAPPSFPAARAAPRAPPPPHTHRLAAPGPRPGARAARAPAGLVVLPRARLRAPGAPPGRARASFSVCASRGIFRGPSRVRGEGLAAEDTRTIVAPFLGPSR